MQNAAAYGGERVREPRFEGVREDQKRYSSILDVRIEEYIRQLQDFETRCTAPGADRNALLAEITAINETMLDVCKDFEQQIKDPFAIKSAQVELREKTNHILSKSYCINRARTWPQGHQGDYNTLEVTYKNSPLSEGIGYYLDKYVLSAQLAHGVRDRISTLREILRRELTARQAPKVLDVACGSCREVFEIASEIKASGAGFVCVDLDEDALTYALDRLTLAGLSEDQVELRKYNALRIFDFDTAKMEFGMQDIIYSVGYFDYLPDDFLVKMLRSLYRLLNPGGKLIAAFKDAKRYRAEVFHWLLNWDGFLQRTEDDFGKLLHYAAIPAGSIAMTRVPSGSVIFYEIRKQ